MVSLVKFDVEHVKLSGYEFGRKLTFQFVKTMHLVLPSPEAQPAPRVHSSKVILYDRGGVNAKVFHNVSMVLKCNFSISLCVFFCRGNISIAISVANK